MQSYKLWSSLVEIMSASCNSLQAITLLAWMTPDLLVHWCHGSSGVIYMLIQAYQVFREERYLNDAYQCVHVTWQYGWLRNGYGLCHSTSGNAFAFLTLFNLTQDMNYPYRAFEFAEWCLDYGEHGCRTSDAPFSLFEGMAGTIYFLADQLVPTKAKFPAFELCKESLPPAAHRMRLSVYQTKIKATIESNCVLDLVDFFQNMSLIQFPFII